MSVLIEAEDLRKCFGPIVAVDNISLTVNTGEVLGFLGPNGAGKSTTMKMITGFLEPDRGRARIAGIDIGSDPKAAKARLGYLPEGAPAYGDMYPETFLRFIAEIRGFTGNDVAVRVDRAIELTGLRSVLDRQIDALSKGFRRRVGLAQAILHDPDVLIMDEPTDGLDPNQKHHVRELISTMAKEKAIIVSTHILEEVEAVCTRAVVIDKGLIVADGTADELQSRLPYHNAVAISVPAASKDAAIAALESHEGISKVDTKSEDGSRIALRVIPKADQIIAHEVAAVMQAKSIPIDELYIERGNLDDVFRQITTSEGDQPHA